MTGKNFRCFMRRRNNQVLIDHGMGEFVGKHAGMKIIQRRPGTRHVLLVCNAVNMVDISGLEMLERINANLLAMGITLHFSEVKAPVMEQLEASDFLDSLHGDIYFTTDQAMRDLSVSS